MSSINMHEILMGSMVFFFILLASTSCWNLGQNCLPPPFCPKYVLPSQFVSLWRLIAVSESEILASILG